MTKIVLITRDDCFYCASAKSILTINEKTYTEHRIGVDMTRDDVLRLYPDYHVLPIVIVDDVVLGGYEDLLDYLYPPLMRKK